MQFEEHKMDDEVVKNKLIAAGVSIEIGIEKLQAIWETKILFLGELVLQSIPLLVDQERKLSLWQGGLMEAEAIKMS